MRTVKVDLFGSGLDDAIKALEGYASEIDRKTETLCNDISWLGVGRASYNFETALYAGTNDVSVSGAPPIRLAKGAYTGTITAVGNSVLFIEFGTGVTYPNDHPEMLTAKGLNYGRGEYGKGRGSNTHWYYRGDMGNLGEPASIGSGDLVFTRGNPANRCMYDAETYMESIARSEARKVFK